MKELLADFGQMGESDGRGVKLLDFS